VTANPDHGGEASKQASDIVFKLQTATGYSPIVEKSMISGTCDQCAMLKHLYNLAGFSDPISKYVSNSLILDLLNVTNGKFGLDHLLQKTVSMKQNFSPACVRLSRDLGGHWSTTLEHILYGRDIRGSKPTVPQLYRLTRIFTLSILQSYGEKLRVSGKPSSTQKDAHSIEKLLHDIDNIDSQGSVLNLQQRLKLCCYIVSSLLQLHSTLWLAKGFEKEDSFFYGQENQDPSYIMDYETVNDTDRNSTHRIFSFDEELDHCIWDRYWLENWLQEDRDFKSFCVIEYDPFQSARRELHKQLLENALDRHFSIL
jgi:hypothetical protein